VGTRSGEMYDSDSDEDEDFELIDEQNEEHLLLRGFDDEEEIQEDEECDEEDFDWNGAGNIDVARNVHFGHSIVDKLNRTCQMNHRGFPFENRNSLKVRGDYVLKYNACNRLLCGQWHDSKVVNFVSTLNHATIATVQRQIGSVKQDFQCPAILTKYQQDMGSIDRSDQMQMQGGGFSNHNHFKKWYKKVYLAILDCMLINSYLACNKSIGSNPMRHQLTRYDLRCNDYQWYGSDNDTE
jgi:hypothetical protein